MSCWRARDSLQFGIRRERHADSGSDSIVTGCAPDGVDVEARRGHQPMEGVEHPNRNEMKADSFPVFA